MERKMMAEAVSLKALARQIFARERGRESLSQGCPNAGETLGQSAGQRAAAREAPADVLALFSRIVPFADGEPGLEQECDARRGRVQEVDGAFLHFCVQCGRFAAFGYGVRLRVGRLGRWYCGEHRPHVHRS
jgi:hypothetical protein